MEQITERARKLRKEQTPAEEMVWERVRNCKLGVKIVRQKPILIDYFNKKRVFVADFYCSKAKLVIEIDGDVHEKQADYDELRTVLIEQKEYNVIRFKNNEVYEDIDAVLSVIKDKINNSINCIL